MRKMITHKSNMKSDRAATVELHREIIRNSRFLNIYIETPSLKCFGHPESTKKVLLLSYEYLERIVGMFYSS